VVELRWPGVEDDLAIVRRDRRYASPFPRDEEAGDGVGLLPVARRVVKDSVVHGAGCSGSENQCGLDGLLRGQGRRNLSRREAVKPGDDSVDRQEYEIEGREARGNLIPAPVPDRVAAVDRPDAGDLDHPSDLVVAPPVGAGDRGQPKRAEFARPPLLDSCRRDPVGAERLHDRLVTERPAGGEAGEEAPVAVVGVQVCYERPRVLVEINRNEWLLRQPEERRERLRRLQRVDEQAPPAAADLDPGPRQTPEGDVGHFRNTLPPSNLFAVARTVDPRTRPALLEAATRLFYRAGVGSVGVQDIVGASGLSKPTFYRHFDSKERLVGAYLDQRHEKLTAELRGAIEAAPPRRRPLAVIDWACSSILEPDFNGCAFVRAYAEAPHDSQIYALLKKRKRVLLETIAQACRNAGVPQPDELTVQLALIVEGATTLAYATGDGRRAAAAARSLAGAVLREAGLDAP
jgi:AcrR family transcriptional regulator